MAKFNRGDIVVVTFDSGKVFTGVITAIPEPDDDFYSVFFGEHDIADPPVGTRLLTGMKVPEKLIKPAGKVSLQRPGGVI